jgi:LacI family transcriptional regulator
MIAAWSSARPAGRRPTIEDVARYTGVSRQTVSRALNDKEDIRPETKARVLDAATLLGYRPSRFARGLVRQDVITLGVIVPDITNPFFPELVAGVATTVEERGWEWQILLGLTGGTRERELAALRRMSVQADAVAGYLFHDDGVIADFQAQMPCVRFDTSFGPATWPGIRIDVEGGLRQTLGRLAETGHREVGMLDSASPIPGWSRRDAFLRLAPQYGLRLDLNRVEPSEHSFASGAEAVGRLLERCPEVSAIFAFNDVIGAGAVLGAQRLGRSVPDGLAVVGFDGLDLGELVSPPLTTVQLDRHRLGALAVQQVKQMLDGASPSSLPVIDLRPHLLVRGTA